MYYDKTLHVINEAFEYSQSGKAARILKGDDIFELVKRAYPKGQPSNTRWYHDAWDTANDVTPKTPEDIRKLNALSGNFYVVTYPADPVTLTIIAVSVAVSVAVAFLMPMPTMPNVGGSQPPSPNNSLAQRTNRQRVGGRVPDIYGTLKCVPDLLTAVYTVYVDHDEVEFTWVCIGRGLYKVYKAYDDLTEVRQIRGANVSVYEPGASLFVDEPVVTFGNAYTDDEAALSGKFVKRFNAINGQVLAPPDNYLVADNNLYATAAGALQSTGDGYNFADQFAVGDTVLVESALNLKSANGVTIKRTETDAEGNETVIDTGEVVTYNLNGEYIVAELTADTITFADPASVNSDWQKLIDNSDMTETGNITLSTESTNLWTDWEYIPAGMFKKIMFNLISNNGLYITNDQGNAYRPLVIDIEAESEILTADGDPIIDTNTVNTFTMLGRPPNRGTRDRGAFFRPTGFYSDDNVRRTAAATFVLDNPHQTIDTPMRVRFRRKTNAVRPDKGQAVDEVKIKDLYGVNNLVEDKYQYNGLMHAYIKQLNTTSALAVKERKAMMLVQRYVRDWRNNDALILSNRIDDILYDIATDPITGGLTIDDLDMPQISAEVDAQIEYFGTDLCAQFCGTFDTTDITTEEMMQTVAQAGFFRVYRINNKIHLKFEKAEELPVANFNSHNILPGTFEYGETFGARNDYDGAQVTYIDPDNNDLRTTLHYPPDKSAVNPDTKDKDLAGVRNKVQAYMHLMRRHWRNQYAYSSCQFTGADETGIVIPTDLINVANQHRADTQQGSVTKVAINKNGQTVLELSNDVDFNDAQQATVFVQTTAATVDNISCYPGEHSRQIILARPPAAPLSTGVNASVKATFNLAIHDDYQRDNYIVSSKAPGPNPLTHRLQCVNATNKYYQSDFDYKKGLITNG